MLIVAGTWLALQIAPARGDTYRCDDNTFTNIPAHYQRCSLIESSVICSPQTGNKFFAPSHPGVASRVERCEVSRESQSPFLNKAARFDPPEKEVSASHEKRSKAAPSATNQPEKQSPSGDSLGPLEAGKLLECSVRALFEGGNPSECGVP